MPVKYVVPKRDYFQEILLLNIFFKEICRDDAYRIIVKMATMLRSLLGTIHRHSYRHHKNNDFNAEHSGMPKRYEKKKEALIH